jgi:hypothetical protein
MTLSVLLWQILQFLGHIQCLQFHFPAVIIKLVSNLKKLKLGSVCCPCSCLVIAGNRKAPNQSKCIAWQGHVNTWTCSAVPYLRQRTAECCITLGPMNKAATTTGNKMNNAITNKIAVL